MAQALPAVSGEPPDTAGSPTSAQTRFAEFRRRLHTLTETASRRTKIATAHPLIVGGALLFIFGGVVGGTSLGVANPAGAAENLGGEDVEVVEVVYQYSPFEEFLVEGAPPFGGDAAGETFDSEDPDAVLVTVPWTPVPPPGSSRHGVATYAVGEGDTLSDIAGRFGVSLLSVAISNNIVDPDAIKPGDELRVPPSANDALHVFLHTVKSGETLAGIAKRYAADGERVIAFNGLPADGVLTAGAELMLPVNEPPEFAKPNPPAPKPVSPTAPRFASSQTALGYYIAPTTGRNYGRIHSNNGVDIANSCGTPVYAAASGTITRADGSGWNGGYGIVIDIAHPNGTSTRYAHLSQIVTWSGGVGQGQLIGYMGTTGRSTGCHLHFEVHGEGARNPLRR